MQVMSGAELQHSAEIKWRGGQVGVAQRQQNLLSYEAGSPHPCPAHVLSVLVLWLRLRAGFSS